MKDSIMSSRGLRYNEIEVGWASVLKPFGMHTAWEGVKRSPKCWGQIPINFVYK